MGFRCTRGGVVSPRGSLARGGLCHCAFVLYGSGEQSTRRHGDMAARRAPPPPVGPRRQRHGGMGHRACAVHGTCVIHHTGSLSLGREPTGSRQTTDEANGYTVVLGTEPGTAAVTYSARTCSVLVRLSRRAAPPAIHRLRHGAERQKAHHAHHAAAAVDAGGGGAEDAAGAAAAGCASLVRERTRRVGEREAATGGRADERERKPGGRDDHSETVVGGKGGG